MPDTKADPQAVKFFRAIEKASREELGLEPGQKDIIELIEAGGQPVWICIGQDTVDAVSTVRKMGCNFLYGDKALAPIPRGTPTGGTKTGSSLNREAETAMAAETVPKAILTQPAPEV